MYHEFFLIYSPLEFYAVQYQFLICVSFIVWVVSGIAGIFLSIIIYCIVKANYAKNNNLTLLQVL